MPPKKTAAKSKPAAKAKTTPKKRARPASDPADPATCTKGMVSSFLTGLKYKQQNSKTEGTLAQQLLEALAVLWGRAIVGGVWCVLV